MKKQNSFSLTSVGGSSLLVIFAVLCLTVFALLSLSSVKAERRLADAAAQSVTDYYRADLQAEEIFARLQNGESLEGIEEIDGLWEFAIPISQRQVLSVALQREGEDWTVLRWQSVTTEGELEQSLNVWQGIKNEEETP